MSKFSGISSLWKVATALKKSAGHPLFLAYAGAGSNDVVACDITCRSLDLGCSALADFDSGPRICNVPVSPDIPSRSMYTSRRTGRCNTGVHILNRVLTLDIPGSRVRRNHHFGQGLRLMRYQSGLRYYGIIVPHSCRRPQDISWTLKIPRRSIRLLTAVAVNTLRSLDYLGVRQGHYGLRLSGICNSDTRYNRALIGEVFSCEKEA